MRHLNALQSPPSRSQADAEKPNCICWTQKNGKPVTGIMEHDRPEALLRTPSGAGRLLVEAPGYMHLRHHVVR
jgi:hypothetical protein